MRWLLSLNEATPTEEVILLQRVYSRIFHEFTLTTQLSKRKCPPTTLPCIPMRGNFIWYNVDLLGESDRAGVCIRHIYCNKSTLLVRRLFGAVEPKPWSAEGKGHHIAVYLWLRPLNPFRPLFSRIFVRVLQAATSHQLASQCFYFWSTPAVRIELQECYL